MTFISWKWYLLPQNDIYFRKMTFISGKWNLFPEKNLIFNMKFISGLWNLFPEYKTYFWILTIILELWNLFPENNTYFRNMKFISELWNLFPEMKFISGFWQLFPEYEIYLRSFRTKCIIAMASIDLLVSLFSSPEGGVLNIAALNNLKVTSIKYIQKDKGLVYNRIQ